MGDKNVLDHIIIDSLSLVFLRLKFYSVEEIALKNLYGLKELYLESHEVINIQTLFGQFPNIEILHYSNHLVEFEFKMSKKRITILHLRKKDLNLDFLINKFCSQTEQFHIHTFDENFEDIIKMLNEYQFQNLFELDMHKCDVSRIEKESFNAQMRTIKSLCISSNKIEIIELDSFSELKQLVSLDLSYNFIESLERRHFSNLINLEVLNLSYNELKKLYVKMFSDLKNLKNIDLSSNLLGTFDAKSFAYHENLTELNLNNNKLSHFDARILDKLPQINRIHLFGNAISNIDELFNRYNAKEVFKSHDLYQYKHK